jgi:5-methylcytosine-specific restriction endonuclease McrA
MRKLYHSEEERREAIRARDRKRNHTEHRHEYDRARSTTDEFRAKRRERAIIKREARLLDKQRNPPMPTTAKQASLFKVCSRCKTEQFLTDFPLHKNRPIGYSPVCKECQRKWTNSEEEKARQRDIKREMRLDPVKGKALRDRLNTWRKEHPESQQELTLRRNARKKQATTERVNYKRILERDGMWCYICEKAILSEKDIHYDHVIPLSRNGAHSEDNIKVSHALCNRRKGNTLLSELTPHQRRGM